MRDGPRTPSGCAREHGSGHASPPSSDVDVVVAGLGGDVRLPHTVVGAREVVLVTADANGDRPRRRRPDAKGRPPRFGGKCPQCLHPGEATRPTLGTTLTQ